MKNTHVVDGLLGGIGFDIYLETPGVHFDNILVVDPDSIDLAD